MSGIAGIYSFDGRSQDAALLGRMSRAIAHRGVDGTRFWTDGCVGLSHLMLHTTPESLGEKQPLRSQDGACCLTLDGRIDNRTEVSVELRKKGFVPRDDTDAEVVLCAYQCWEEQCPVQLLGDFAFAIWDSRKRVLFCARDYVGVRPFYYYFSRSLFAFGSEIRAVLALPSVPRRLNESRVVDFLVDELERVDKQSTFYQDILRLPAGHSLTVTPDRLTVRDYWQLKAGPILKLRSLQEYGEAFRDVFVEAVRCRLRSNYPVASTLSGGLDSSSVVCTTRELLGSELSQPLHTISLVDACERECGETPYIKEVLRGGRVTPHIVRSDEIADFRQAIRESDEPFQITQYFQNWFIFDAARKAGTRVLLDGISGDHIMPPDEYLATLVRSMAWRTLFRELSYRSVVEGENWPRALFYLGLVPLMPTAYRSIRWVLRRRDCPPPPNQTLLDESFAARMGVCRRLELKRREHWIAARDVGALHAWGFTSGILPFFFEQSSALGAFMQVETRHPFLDRRVIDFVLSLPLTMKLYAPVPKQVIRTAMQGILPETVRRRTAFAHVGPAFMLAAYRRHAELMEPGVFEQQLECVRGYVNVRRALGLRKGLAAAWSSDDAYSVWQVLMLADWLNSRTPALKR